MTTISKAARKAASEADRSRTLAERQHHRRQATIDRLITESGWAVCTWNSDSPTDPGKHFGYTIGRTLRSQPELCVWGDDVQAIQGLLNLVGGLLDKGGHTLSPGDELLVPGGMMLRASHVPASNFGDLEYAKERYTFLRALRIQRVR